MLSIQFYRLRNVVIVSIEIGFCPQWFTSSCYDDFLDRLWRWLADSVWHDGIATAEIATSKVDASKYSESGKKRKAAVEL